jgi:hypothetical protein
MNKRSLRSSCNILIAVDAGLVLAMHLGMVVHWTIVWVWQTVSLGRCFAVLLVPSLGMESSGTIQMAIALDRFLHVFFPFWQEHDICFERIFKFK